MPIGQNRKGGSLVEIHDVQKQLTRIGQVEHRKGITLSPGFWKSKVATQDDQGQ